MQLSSVCSKMFVLVKNILAVLKWLLANNACSFVDLLWRRKFNRKLKITSGRKRALNAGRKRAECRRPFFNLNLPYRSVTGIEFRILSQVCLSLYQVFLDDMHGRQTVIFS